MSLADLIERVEGATGPDREADCELWALHHGLTLEWQGTTLVAGEEGVVGWIDPGRLARNFYTNRAKTGPGSIPAYTASIDAALALCERVLPEAWPGFQRNRVTDPARAWSAWLEIFPEGVNFPDTYDFNAPTPALALILAMLKALQAKEAGE